MLIRAQGEKAVTISERTGRPRHGRVAPAGWKTPHYAILFAQGKRFPTISESANSSPKLAFYPVFSGLKAKEATPLKRLSRSSHNLTKGNLVVTWRGRFGPNFVTIQPTGVCVCSF